ncbi:hypothetical protein [Terrisporobacter sp.]|uniref:hypothetical protein n=1 Tax=Terrisporobacter sp. TaxID=1965305 RepID=UPI00261A6E69|nr:hypothetical protein [Terrisporobacter sp.]
MEEKSVEELKKENSLQFAKRVNSTAIDAIDELYNAFYKNRKSTTSQIQNYLDNPLKNAKHLQDTAEYMRMINGVLKEITLYKSNMLTYDYFLIPTDMSKYKTKDKFETAYRKAVLEVKKYNIKFHCRWLSEKTIRKGEMYIYKVQSDDGITIVEMPNSICKIVGATSGLQRYAVDLTSIKEDTLNYYPDGIQKLYKKYKNNQLKKDKNFKDGYYKIPLEDGVAFSIEYLETKGVPYYTSLLRELSLLEDMKNLEETSAVANNFKVLHQTIPTGEDGEISVDAETAFEYHQALKSICPEGVAALSTPYKINPLTLGDNKQKNLDYVNKIERSIFDNAAINDDIFSGTKSNNQAIIYGANVDSLLAFNLLQKFKMWLNFDFKKNNSLKNFEVVFVDSTIMDKDSKIKMAVNNITTWNSRMQLFAYMGYEPWEAYNILKMEEIMNFDELMPALMTSHTASSSDVGRTTVADDPDKSGNVGQAQN